MLRRRTLKIRQIADSRALQRTRRWPTTQRKRYTLRVAAKEHFDYVQIHTRICYRLGLPLGMDMPKLITLPAKGFSLFVIPSLHSPRLSYRHVPKLSSGPPPQAPHLRVPSRASFCHSNQHLACSTTTVRNVSEACCTCAKGRVNFPTRLLPSSRPGHKDKRHASQVTGACRLQESLSHSASHQATLQPLR